MFDELIQAVIAGCVASFAVYYFKTSRLFRYSLDVLERVCNRQSFPLYECIGGIVVTLDEPNKRHIDMEEVPDALYQRALKLAEMQTAWDMPPIFDLKVMGKRHTYWIHAGRESRSHVLTFFRRPRFFTSSNTAS